MSCLCEQTAIGRNRLSQTCIGHLWIFQDLNSKDLEALVQGALRRKWIKGRSIFLQGDPADEMFLIKGGRIKINKVLENGTEITLDIRKAGDFVGENMLSGKGIYPVSAWCMEDTLTCGFSRAQFEKLVLEHPNIGLQVIKSLSQKISWLTTRVENLVETHIEDRLYRVLHNVAKEHGVAGPRGRIIQFPLTHEELSFLIGAHRVSITRAMKSLKTAGKIIVEGKILIVPD